MTDIEKVEARIQQLLSEIDYGHNAILPDLIAEAVKEYGELRDEAGYDRGWDAGHAAQHAERAWG